MGSFINPFTDFGFKKIFGQPKDRIILIGFLNALLQDTVFNDVIVDISYEDKEMLGDDQTERTIISDIHCTTEDGRNILLEMQLSPHANFTHRMLYYASRAIVGQARKGDWDFKLDAVYMVSIANFMIDDTDQRIRIDRGICDIETGKPVNDLLRFIYIQLPAFRKTTPEDCENDFEKWIYTLKNLQEMKTIPFAPRDNAFLRLQEVASEAALSPEERKRYERDQKQYWIITNIERSRYNEGIAKGEAIGIAKGEAIGIAKGEDKAWKEIVLSMRSNGMDDHTIAKITGKSPEWIKTISL